MQSIGHPVRSGPLADLDLVELGARSGLLWRSPQVTLAGVGPVSRIRVVRPDGSNAAQTDLTENRVAFAAFPFSPDRPGELIVPEVTIMQIGSQRHVIADNGGSDPIELVEEVLDAEPSGSPSRIELVPRMPAPAWRDQVVGPARAQIRSGELTKVVLARQLLLRADQPFDVAECVRRLAIRFPAAMIFSIDGFVGASPELLVARDVRSVRSHPLAGTAARSTNATIDAERVVALRRSTKDQLEHRITIEWLLKELLPFCSYVDAEPEPSVVSMANVHHLATAVEGMLSAPAPSVLELVAAVHPTPALGGDPQANALALIDDLEGFDRGRYGGPVGWLDGRGNGEFAVAVRSAQISGSEALVAAGVGVVADSDLDAELAETQSKFGAALGALLG